MSKILSEQLSRHTFFCKGIQSRRKCIHRRTHITQYTESRALSTRARLLRTIGVPSYECCRNERNWYLEYWWDYRVTARGPRKGALLCAYYCCTRTQVSQVHEENAMVSRLTHCHNGQDSRGAPCFLG